MSVSRYEANDFLYVQEKKASIRRQRHIKTFLFHTNKFFDIVAGKGGVTLTNSQNLIRFCNAIQLSLLFLLYSCCQFYCIVRLTSINVQKKFFKFQFSNQHFFF